MERLGIISDSTHIYLMPKVGSKKYYCLWWAEKGISDFTLSNAFLFSKSQSLLGPQELTTWLE